MLPTIAFRINLSKLHLSQREWVFTRPPRNAPSTLTYSTSFLNPPDLIFTRRRQDELCVCAQASKGVAHTWLITHLHTHNPQPATQKYTYEYTRYIYIYAFVLPSSFYKSAMLWTDEIFHTHTRILYGHDFHNVLHMDVYDENGWDTTTTTTTLRANIFLCAWNVVQLYLFTRAKLRTPNTNRIAVCGVLWFAATLVFCWCVCCSTAVRMVVWCARQDQVHLLLHCGNLDFGVGRSVGRHHHLRRFSRTRAKRTFALQCWNSHKSHIP